MELNHKGKEIAIACVLQTLELLVSGYIKYDDLTTETATLKHYQRIVTAVYALLQDTSVVLEDIYCMNPAICMAVMHCTDISTLDDIYTDMVTLEHNNPSFATDRWLFVPVLDTEVDTEVVAECMYTLLDACMVYDTTILSHDNELEAVFNDCRDTVAVLKELLGTEFKQTAVTMAIDLARDMDEVYRLFDLYNTK